MLALQVEVLTVSCVFCFIQDVIFNECQPLCSPFPFLVHFPTTGTNTIT